MGWLLTAPALSADGGKSSSNLVDPNVIACIKVPAADMERIIGAPARILETSSGLCSWEGGKPGAYAQVMYFAGASHGVPAGAECAYFDQMIDGTKAQYKADELAAIPGIGESAWGLKLTDNAPNFYAVYFYKNKDNVTITTNGVGYDATVEIARLAASRV